MLPQLECSLSHASQPDEDHLLAGRHYLALLRWTTMVPATMSYTVLLCWKKSSVMKTGKRKAMEKFLLSARTVDLRRIETRECTEKITSHLAYVLLIKFPQLEQSDKIERKKVFKTASQVLKKVINRCSL